MCTFSETYLDGQLPDLKDNNFLVKNPTVQYNYRLYQSPKTICHERTHFFGRRGGLSKQVTPIIWRFSNRLCSLNY